MDFLTATRTEPPKLGIQVKGTKFYKDGKEFRGIGMNHFSLAHNVAIDMMVGGKRDGKADIAEIKDTWGLPFVRAAFGMFGRDSWLYRWNNKAAVWAYLDSIVAECEAKGLGIIPVLVWDSIGFCDLSYARFGTFEGPSALANPNSNSRAMMQEWLTEVVTRYRNSPAIWGWALCNEFTVRCGPEYYKFWAPDGSLFSWLNWGKRPDNTTSYSTSDYMSTTQWADYSRWAIQLIEQADGYGRFVSPGSAFGNSYAVNCQTANSYAADTKAQWDVAADKLPWVRYRDQSFPIVCAHLYPQNTATGQVFFGDHQYSNGELIGFHKEWANQVNKPFFLEEFGATWYGDPAVDQQSRSPETEQIGFYSALNSIIDNDVMMSAVWNYDGDINSAIAWQTWRLRDTPTRRYQLEACAAANAVMASRN